MSIVVEDGTGKSNANSLCSVAVADAYLAIQAATAWAAADNTTKENALMKATQYIETVYRERWKERRWTLAQAFSWPRFNMEDSDGSFIGETVPLTVQQAVAEVALRVVQGDSLLPDVSTSDANIVSESVTVGPITTSTTYNGAKSVQKRYNVVEHLLAQWLEPKGRIWRA